MAHSRFNRRRRRHHLFGKKKEAAIRAIALGPVETKKFWYAATGYSATGTNQDYGRYYNLFHNIPKADVSAVGDSEESVIGNQFMSRGVKIFIQSTNTSDYEVIFRATVLSDSTFFGTTLGGGSLVSSDAWYEQDISQVLPRKRYNTQNVNVLQSKVWSSKKQYATQGPDECFIEMWVPITGKKTSEAESETNTIVGQLKGRQYYLLLEQYIAGAPATPPNSSISVYPYWVVYFKDA